MTVSAVNSQASQAATLINSLSTPTVSTTVTSTDPTVLKNQTSQLSTAITQLQSSGGSSQQIQKLQQALLTAQNQLKKQQALAEEKQASNQATGQDVTQGIDVKA